ncbi:glycosyltransferase [Flavivirga amylovorans]|uniref:Glycosyltransferase n=1 Tax=Flavivirga amylovorans TaxID=870486 RepID=A0ABT8WXF0_9FLAO|nr:glycosyltransferase [Flavivirga amylovorans]MDO5986372.1 glycosyltransferase [Flavivirga amylovorans]
MKTKVLFLVSDFYHGGAQREMFELDSVIDKSSIDVNILCLSQLNSSEYFTDFFYEKHLGIKTTVFFLEDIIPNSKSGLLKKIANRIQGNKNNLKKRKALETFLNGFTRVFFMGEYVFQSIASILSQNYFEKVIIFIMSARFQGEHYRNLPKDVKYLFISGFDKQEEVDYEFEGFTNYNHIPLLLSLRVSEAFNNWKFESHNKVKKIGIFTRLNKSKPLDPFFYALHILLNELPNVELHIFGAGDYKKAGYDRYISHLQLSKKIFFKGHQKDIKASINKERLDLVWFQGYNNKPAGYAALDICLTGIPLLLWDFYAGINIKINQTEEVFPHFKDLSLFVEASKKVLQNEEFANAVSEKQFKYVIDKRDIEQNINAIKHLFN